MCPVLQIISRLDRNVKYEGGMTEEPGGQYNPPMDSILNVVAERAGCQQAKQVTQSTALFTSYRWTSCAETPFAVELYLTEDGGHSWPGGNKGSTFGDDPSLAFENNEVIWAFFGQYVLP
jgi:polyhydroxybutyrate depolymerase